MTTIKQLFVSAVLGSCLILSSCDKECPKEKDKVVHGKKLELSGAQEVPVRETKAYGKMDVSYNKKTRVLTYEIEWANLTGPPVGSHIHGPAARGVNAPIKHDFTALIPKTASGSFTNSVVVDGVAIVEDQLLMGLYYVNIHTQTFPGGEIRGADRI